MSSFSWSFLVGMLLLGGLLVSSEIASAQSDTTDADGRPYDAISAGRDAFNRAEADRQNQVRQQIQINDNTRFWGGVPTSRGDVLYYNQVSPIYGPAVGYSSYGSSYRSGYGIGYGNGISGSYRSAYGIGYGSGGYGVPYRNGYSSYSQQSYLAPIIGYRSFTGPVDPDAAYYSNPVRQPIGQRQVQTGPNRWESYPIYSPEIPSSEPLPPVDSPLLDRTPYASRKPITTEPMPSPKPKAGREF